MSQDPSPPTISATQRPVGATAVGSPVTPPQTPPALELGPAASPIWIEYLVLLCGCGLSLWLTEILGLKVDESSQEASWKRSLPLLLFFPVGLVSVWPVLFSIGRIRGRSKRLTLVEGLWGVLWLFDVLLIATICVYANVDWSEFDVVEKDDVKSIGRGLLVIVGALSVVAGIVFALIGRIFSGHKAWTHHFGIAMLLWPAIPILLIQIGNVTIQF
ncbi:MAG: hypothetical protein ACFCD0_20200 [Gemmataceae bacterium]